jgi:tetratricopeptide (TPR) repeat protein
MMDRLYRAVGALRVPVAAGGLMAVAFAAMNWPQVWHTAPHVAPAFNTTASFDSTAGPGYPPTLLRLPDQVKPVALTYSSPTPETASAYTAEPTLGDPRFASEPDEYGSSVLHRMPPVDGSSNSHDVSRSAVPTLPPWSDELSRADGPWYDESPPQIRRLPTVPQSSPSAYDENWQPTQPTDQPQPTEQPRTSSDRQTWEPDITPAIEASSKPKLPELPELNAAPARDDWHAPQPAVAPDNSPQVDAAMSTVAQRADELTRHGFSLAERGAYYSARADFIQALRLISQALDVQAGGQSHSQSLADGLQALKEADDFAPRGSRLEADLDLAMVVSGHRTPVLKETDLAHTTPLEALQRYYTYAQDQLANAGGHQPAASMALYGFGKLHMAFSEQSADAQKLNGPKAMALHQAALLVDAKNYLAANELGVLLARYGQLQDARSVLLHGVTVGRQPDAWHNLSVVHQRLGEVDLARRASYEHQLCTESARGGAGGAGYEGSVAAGIQWVPPQAFSSPSPTPASPAREQPPEKKDKTAWWFPWQQIQR